MDFAQTSSKGGLYGFMEKVEHFKIQISFSFHVFAFQSSLTFVCYRPMPPMAYLKGKHSKVQRAFSASKELSEICLVFWDYPL
jgi:hypothetical protein